MVLITRITCTGYLLILISWAIFDTFVIKSSPIYSVYLWRFVAALIVIVVIAGAAAAFTLRALSMASHAALGYACVVNAAYPIAMIAAIILIRTDDPQAIPLIPVFSGIALVSMISILGLGRARKAWNLDRSIKVEVHN